MPETRTAREMQTSRECRDPQLGMCQENGNSIGTWTRGHHACCILAKNPEDLIRLNSKVADWLVWWSKFQDGTVRGCGVVPAHALQDSRAAARAEREGSLRCGREGI